MKTHTHQSYSVSLLKIGTICWPRCTDFENRYPTFTPHSNRLPLLYIALLKVVLCLIIGFYNQKRNPNTRFLLIFLCLLILLDVNMYLQTEGVSGNLMLIFFMHTSPFSVLLGPILFFYVRSTLLDQNRLKSSDFLHFVPFFLISADLMAYFQLPVEEKRRIIKLISSDMGFLRVYARGHILNHYQYTLIRWSLWFGYLLYILYVLYHKRPGLKPSPGSALSQYRIIYTWLLTLSLSFLAVLFPTMFVILDFDSGRVSMNGTEYLSMPAFVISMVIYVLACLSILMYPQILYGLPRLSLPISGEISSIAISPTDQVPAVELPRVSTSGDSATDEDSFRQLAAAIESYIREERPYLDPDFSISTISLRFKIPQHHVHYCFSRIIQSGFPAYRNRLRVEFAKDLLSGGHGRKLTIDAIGRQSGFAAKMNFYTAFKKETGMTPRQYLESLDKEIS